MLVYVDDIILIGNADHLKRFIDQLSALFSLKDLGNLSYFLEMEAHLTPKGLLLTQSRYIADLLEKKKDVWSKASSNTNVSQQLSNSIQWVTNGRTDTVSHSSRELTIPPLLALTSRSLSTNYHSSCISPQKTIFYSTNNTPSLHEYTGADWVGNKDDYMSTGAYIIYFGRHPHCLVI